MAGWGTFFGTLMEKLPILTPAQRRRANIAKLEKEIKDIEDLPWTPDRAVLVIRKHDQLDQLRKNAVDQ